MSRRVITIGEDFRIDELMESQRMNLGTLRMIIPFVLVCLAESLRADVVPAFLLNDNAVLQRDKPIPVWGMADPGENVSVSFAGHTVTTTADASGKWRIELPPLPADAKPSNLVIKGKNTITRTNIVVGEVWLASGQSNMEMTVRETYDAALDIPGSARFPMIRHIRTDYRVSETPLTAGSGVWKVAGPDTTGEFTAVGYYFALSIYEVLNVPVGIIHSSRGGSLIHAWADPATLRSSPDFAHYGEAWAKAVAGYPERKAKLDADIARWEAEKAAAQSGKKSFNLPRPAPGWAGIPGGPDDQTMPSGLYNGMIQPLVPYALRGAIWYQGEGNAGNHVSYTKLFPALITGWRTQFAQGEFPFYWVQLANYNLTLGTNMAFLREAQTRTLSLPGTG